jgi:alpha-galactosidase
MGLLLWFEPERVPEGNTEVYNMASAKGWLRSGMYDYSIPEARQWMFELLDSVISAYGVDVYRQDANLGYYYAAWTKDEDKQPDRAGVTEALHVAGMYKIFDDLRARHPDLMLDTCASGGRRIDIETLRRMAPLHRTDWGPTGGSSYTPMQAHNYGLSLWVPVHGTTWDAGMPGLYRNDTAWLSALASSNDHSNLMEGSWGNASATWWPDLLTLHRRLAVARPLLRGDFYPLTDWSLNESSWMAWQHVRAEESGGIISSDIPGSNTVGPVALVQAFRRYHAVAHTQRYPLHGLDPAASYTIVAWDDDNRSHAVRRTGEELGAGLEVTIGSTPGAAMLLIYA